MVESQVRRIGWGFTERERGEQKRKVKFNLGWVKKEAANKEQRTQRDTKIERERERVRHNMSSRILVVES